MEWSELMKNRTFITDVGESRTSLINGQEVIVGRYAVWSPVTNSESHQVIEVGDALDKLKQKYGIPDDRVCRIISDKEEK